MNIQRATTDALPEEISFPLAGDMLFLEDGFLGGGGVIQSSFTVPKGVHVTYVLSLMPSSALHRTLSVFLEQGASVNLLGIIAGRSDTPISLSLKECHIGKGSVSIVRLRSLLQAGAALDVKGTLAIQEGATTSDAFLESRALLLGKGAHATMTPSLEIEAQDVKAAHAAAAGPIDPEQVFYLCSRGIDPAVAQQMVVRGFVEDILVQVPQKEAQSNLSKRWQEYLTRLS